ncbi:amino acid adenylation domain-containing protein, partial [Neisseriaceae bacterium TC5R-5]|nr:amino acid adenylation domain-containing protein [Neisseriaceae bacterium TC5R-5]
SHNFLPIGRPLANTQIYILDSQGQPVPLGVSGEIHIGGAGVARGYLNRPELTAERFIVDPFSQQAGARMYKTGDLGRWLADGNIEYLGRNDFQVKVRGFRIELGEIEAKLAACAGVREAVVLAREDVAGDKRLVAYLVLNAGVTLEPADLRSHLSTSLAEYMLPSAFVMLDALPLTPNGKLDRKALPAPDDSALVTREYEAPQGELEIPLAEIWQDLLGVERVGRHDNFFELGGHSLLIVSLIERLRLLDLTLEVSAVFAAPTLAGMASKLSGDTHSMRVPANLIPADCRRITPKMLPLVSLSQSEIDQITANVVGGTANIQDIYPLAPLQEGILFHHLLGGEGDPYLLHIMMAFDSRQRVEGFLQALQRVINRHDILRSAVQWQGLVEPIQVVHRSAPLPVRELTLSTEGDAEQQLRELTDPRHVRLDLTQAPLFAVSLAQNPASGEWLLALLQHHLVSDHLALEILFDEIQVLLAGQGASLPPSLPYRNFIAQVRSVPLAVHEAYFREQLSDIEEPTAPFGLLDVRGDGGEVSEARLMLDRPLAQAVREVARQQGVSVAVLFHVMWAQVLAQCSGRDDVVFGTLLLGRSQGVAGADQVLGLFINTLPLRVQLGERSVRQVVQDTYQRLSTLLTHEQAPLALAQRCSGVAAPLPLFNSLLNYRHSQGDEASQSWEGMRLVSAEERTNYPLSLSVDDLGMGLALTAQSSGGVAPERLIAYAETALCKLVIALRNNPEQAIQQLSILPAREREQVLVDFNATAAPYPQQALIHQLFEQQAARAPAAIALRYGDEELSYSELNRRANQLAHRLIALGIRPDDRVAICVERSLEMVVGLLGILKAGGAYVPLDPSYPVERLAYMLTDSEPVALLTQTDLLGQLPEVAVPTLLLDEAGAWAVEASDNPDAVALGLNAKHLAYVIYTSGSTGLPKGVMVEHRGVTNLACVQANTFNIRADSRVLQFASFSFDAGAWEWIMALCNGASLCLAAKEDLLPGQPLMHTLHRHQITHTTLPSSALPFLKVDGLTTGLVLIVAGEACPVFLARQWSQQHRFFNAYGPTEATVCASMYECGVEHHDALPIGRPLANAQIYILDSHGQPVPLGLSGEIHIGGAGVARGYLNRPELTAERFIADPFSEQAGARMYKTGDLGRWLADGNIEYLGRNDFQVKIRGFRIELGEIEAKLAQCEGVREAVVLAREDVAGDKRLVAYLVLNEGVTLEPADLRSRLSVDLVEYMLPSAFVMLEALPLTPNGKLDRKALPAPDDSALVTREYEAPQGELEIQLAEIWQDLLGVERVGRHDNFFELGGHSLSAVQLATRIQEVFHIELPIIEIFNKSAFLILAECILSKQVETFLGDDAELMKESLAALSEDELLEILNEHGNY